MTLCTRPESPMLTGTSGRQRALVQAEDKIHRIVLNTRALCVLAHVRSPNCVWFKLDNHVSEQLQLCRPSHLEKLNTATLKEYDYVMAPLGENVYARGRVVEISSQPNSLVYVHFIDEGHGAWMHRECLAVMDRKLYFHPWQAFPVALFKCYQNGPEQPIIGPGQVDGPERQELLRVLAQYPLFRVVPVRGNQRNAALNNYREYIRAEVYGLTSSDANSGRGDKTGDAIAHMLGLLQGGNRPTNMRRAMYEASQLPVLAQSKQELYDDLNSTIPVWRNQFPRAFAMDTVLGADPMAAVDRIADQLEQLHAADAQWDPDPAAGATVRALTLHWLRTRCAPPDPLQAQYELVQLCLDWQSIKSPHEFYAFPLEQPTPNGAPAAKSPMRVLYEQQVEWADQLDSFYGMPCNRKQFIPVEIAAQLRAGTGQPVCAIHEGDKNEFVGTSGTGTFRRVQVISIRRMNARSAVELENEFCRIRYLDIGGSDVVPLSGLLRMHSRHSQRPPMCVQLTLERICPPNRASEWSPEECAHFRRLCRTDRPMLCQLRALEPPGQTCSYNASPARWPGVFGAHRLVEQQYGNPGDGTECVTVEEHMVRGTVRGSDIPVTGQPMAAWNFDEPMQNGAGNKHNYGGFPLQ